MAVVGIFLYPDVEVLDFAGPFEVFTKAASLVDSTTPIEVCVIAESLAPLRARAGLMVTPQADIHQHPELDLLIIPGGLHHAQLRNTAVLQWVRQQAQQVEVIASVCTGVFILAQAGVLSDQRVTTHWDDIAELRTMFPTLRVQENVRWVDAGRVVSSAGISAGIDMSLHLVSRLYDTTLAEATARRMEFDWSPDSNGARP